MAEHKHGSMDIKTHEKTFAGFVTFSKWVVILTILHPDFHGVGERLTPLSCLTSELSPCVEL